MFLILVASNAMDGTFLDYRPATFTEWERGAWERGTWGMNDEWAESGPGPGPALSVLIRHRRKVKAAIAWRRV